jgi:3-oxoacid CoA-transferase
MAKAAKLAIVEAENIVEVGSIDPNDVDLPGVYIDRIVPATIEPMIETLVTRDEDDGKGTAKAGSADQKRRNRIARRAAKELKDGFYVNLGVGKRYCLIYSTGYEG